MAVKSDLVAGTITLTNGSIDFTGTGTSFLLGDVREGDEFKQIEGQTQWEAMVASITSNTAGTLVRPWGGATGTFAYRLRYQPDGTRSTAQARQLIELLGDGTLLSIAGLVGPGVIELLPGGGAQVVPKTDLVSGVAVDVRVKTIAERATYDGQAAQFSVYVNNIGDGRAAVYFKQSAATADWSTPAIQTGPKGDASTVPGVIWRGAYSSGTAYAVNDGVTFNGSSFRKLTIAAAGTAPSSASPPVTTADWEVLAAKGANGAGTVGSVASGTGISVNSVDPTAPVVSLASVPTATFKGRSAAGTGAPSDLTPTEALALLKSAGAYAKDNILGTVSQSSGMPTDAIIEWGSNPSGSYIRLTDGTQICHFKSTSALATTVVVGNVFASVLGTFTFPVAFITPPGVAFNAVFSAVSAPWVSGGPITKTTAGLYLLAAVTSASGFPEYIAIGRWI